MVQKATIINKNCKPTSKFQILTYWKRGMMWQRHVSSAVLAPRAVRVTPGLPLHPAPTLGLGARPLHRLSFALQCRRCGSHRHGGAALLRRLQLPPPLSRDESEDVCILSLLGVIVRQSKDHLTTLAGRWPLTSSFGRCLLPNSEHGPVDVFDPGASLGGWASNLRPIYTRGWRHEHRCSIMTINLGNTKEITQ